MHQRIICELRAICIGEISTENFNQYYARVLSSKLQRSIKKTVVGGENNETLPLSGIEPRMFSPGVVRVRWMHCDYWTHYLLSARSVAWGNFLQQPAILLSKALLCISRVGHAGPLHCHVYIDSTLYIPNPVLSRSRFFARWQYFHRHGSKMAVATCYKGSLNRLIDVDST